MLLKLLLKWPHCTALVCFWLSLIFFRLFWMVQLLVWLVCVAASISTVCSWKHGFELGTIPLCFSLITGHLFYKFGISESDWYRIKQSIDSKCRTAWRRKQRGQSLAVKSFSRRTPSSSSYSGSGKRKAPKIQECGNIVFCYILWLFLSSYLHLSCNIPCTDVVEMLSQGLKQWWSTWWKGRANLGSSGVCNVPEWPEGMQSGSSPSQPSFKGWQWRWWSEGSSVPESLWR